MTPCGRLAPSPTGLAHLGNAWAFLAAWLAVRSEGGRLVLRMEDLDQERTSVVYAQMLLEDIRWLGLDWDLGPTPEKALPAYHQSNRSGIYRAALERLELAGLCYPCFCSRKDLQLASAPHLGDAGPAYPGTCRDLDPEELARRLARKTPHALRFRSFGRVYEFEDAVLGPQRMRLEDCGGDFSLRRADGVFSYQMAVSVDDGLMGISQVVRGRDILPSTPRQVAILEALGLPVPEYWHIPLLLDSDGERLAKRHASLSLEALRTDGARPERIIGLFARVMGLREGLEPLRPRELLSVFDAACLRRDDYRVTEEDLTWIRSGRLTT